MGCSWAVVDKANVARETWAGLLFACPWWTCGMLKSERTSSRQSL